MTIFGLQTGLYEETATLIPSIFFARLNMKSGQLVVIFFGVVGGFHTTPTTPSTKQISLKPLHARPPQSPRPEQIYDAAKVTRAMQRKLQHRYDPEYDDDIAMATRKLFELRMRKSMRLPFKSHEFKELRRYIARLKTQQRMDELRAQGHDPRKRKPKTRRERERAKAKRLDKEQRRAKHLRRLEAARQRRGKQEYDLIDSAPKPIISDTA